MEREFRALDLLVKTNREKDREPRRVQLAEDVPKETKKEELLVTSFSGNLLFVVLLLCVQEAKREHGSRPFFAPFGSWTIAPSASAGPRRGRTFAVVSIYFYCADYTSSSSS